MKTKKITFPKSGLLSKKELCFPIVHDIKIEKRGFYERIFKKGNV